MNSSNLESNSVFASSYLKDIQHGFDSYHSLGPFMAAADVTDLMFLRP